MNDSPDPRKEPGVPRPDETPVTVPLQQRRGAVTMTLLWVTMVTGFPTVLAGFDWYQRGFTLTQVTTCVLVSCAILLLYSLPACYLGAKTGLTYTALSRRAFGAKGSWLVAGNIIWASIAWYALTAVFLCQGLQALFHIGASSLWLSAGLAVLMACNNFFGFSGIANFARYGAGPVLIVWVLYCFGQAADQASPQWLAAPAQQPWWQALTTISAFVIGYAVWGNEADYWRFGKPSAWRTALPLIASVAVGQVLFPIAGWMVAALTHTIDPAAGTAAMNSFAFGDARFVAAVVLIVSYVAVNDSLLFATVNALDNVYVMSRRKRVAMLAAIGALLAALLSQASRAFEVVASLSAIILPAATTIILVEAFFPRAGDQTGSGTEQRSVGWPAVLSLAIGSAVGVWTSDIVPGTAAFGIPSLQAWLAAMAAYLLLRRRQHAPPVS